jgi:hypothetical protein
MLAQPLSKLEQEELEESWGSEMQKQAARAEQTQAHRRTASENAKDKGKRSERRTPTKNRAGIQCEHTNDVCAGRGGGMVKRQRSKGDRERKGISMQERKAKAARGAHLNTNTSRHLSVTCVPVRTVRNESLDRCACARAALYGEAASEEKQCEREAAASELAAALYVKLRSDGWREGETRRARLITQPARFAPQEQAALELLELEEAAARFL